jgi:hypothetical protein
MAAVVYSAFELQAGRATLEALSERLAGYFLVTFGRSVPAVWLQLSNGEALFLTVAQRDLQFKFEVFTLRLATMAELQRICDDWVAPMVGEEMPALVKAMMTTRPSLPVLPIEFEPWPFRSWRTEVVRRAESIVEVAAAVPAFGENPNFQSASKPGSVPQDALASCEVAAGLMFTGLDRKRVLVAVDWIPMNIVFSTDEGLIDAFVEHCDLIPLDDYLIRLDRPD